MSNIFFVLSMLAIGLFALWEAFKDYRNGRVVSVRFAGRLKRRYGIDADRDKDPSGFWQGVFLKTAAGIIFIGWSMYSFLTGHLPGG
ncbi:MAG: DUF2542 family protein [Planctomycetota bacterium]